MSLLHLIEENDSGTRRVAYQKFSIEQGELLLGACIPRWRTRQRGGVVILRQRVHVYPTQPISQSADFAREQACQLGFADTRGTGEQQRGNGSLGVAHADGGE